MGTEEVSAISMRLGFETGVQQNSAKQDADEERKKYAAKGINIDSIDRSTMVTSNGWSRSTGAAS